MDQKSSRRPAIFGEVLFDLFPGGVEALGGAPFNVAWNLKGFGADPLFISRVGDDAKGERVLESMRAFGLDTDAVQVDPDRPTGVVEVIMSADGHTFDILPGQAYDFIHADTALDAVASADLSMLYHGALAARCDTSRKALETIRGYGNTPVFVDVNLRPPWTDGASAAKALGGARWAKLNDEELAMIAGRPLESGRELETAAEQVRAEYSIELLVVTRGENGAFFATAGGVLGEQPEPIDEMADTVGAGDAFAAVTIMGVTNGWPLDVTLRRAVAFAASVCRIRGAVSESKDFYLRQLQRWDAE